MNLWRCSSVISPEMKVKVFCNECEMHSASDTAIITPALSHGLLHIHYFNILIMISFFISHSSLKLSEPKSIIYKFSLSKYIRAAFLWLLIFPPSRFTSSTVQSWFSSCWLLEHKYINTVQLSLLTQSHCLCSNSLNRLQLKSKSSRFCDTSRYTRLHRPQLSLISSSASINASTHLASNSRNRGWCSNSRCVIIYSA